MADINLGLAPGTTLRQGTYKIDRELGNGGFGITYLATDLSLDRQVAIKEFFPKDYCDRDSTTSHVTLGTKGSTEFVNKMKVKFLKEARNIAKFDFSGIIRIYAAFEENDTAYYVMEYIDGESLSDKIKRHGPLSPAKAVECVTKVGRALAYVHAHKINHLDVKPANIMVRSENDEPILIDFGLSKQYDSEGHQTSTTPTGISHGFAPFEQYQTGGVQEFSPQSDIYSLGATLYYLLSGVVPPQAPLLVDDALTFPKSIPSNLVPVISKAMAVSRKNRYVTMDAFLKDLTKAAGAAEDSEETEMPASRPEPRVISRPEPLPTSREGIRVKETVAVTPEKKKTSLYIIIGIVVAVAVVASIVMLLPGKSGDAEKASTSAAQDTQTVTSMFYHSALGDCSYTGEVDTDSLPNGKGVAVWSSGEGKKYDGEWVHGVMEGKTTYIEHSGDIFVGTFKNNAYSNGRYTIVSDGSYFEGTFKKGLPDTGFWYDKNGKKDEEYKNGKSVKK
jgi:serine/threonine protein kinase